MSEPTPAINDQSTPVKPEQGQVEDKKPEQEPEQEQEQKPTPAPVASAPATLGGKSCKSKQKHGGKKTRKLTEWQLLVRRVMNENKHKKNYKFGDALKEAKTLYRKKGGYVNKSTTANTAKSLPILKKSNKHTKRTK